MTPRGKVYSVFGKWMSKYGKRMSNYGKRMSITRVFVDIDLVNVIIHVFLLDDCELELVSIKQHTFLYILQSL